MNGIMAIGHIIVMVVMLREGVLFISAMTALRMILTRRQTITTSIATTVAQVVHASLVTILLDLRDNMNVGVDTVMSCMRANVAVLIGGAAALLVATIPLIRAERRTLPVVLAKEREFLTKDILQGISA